MADSADSDPESECISSGISRHLPNRTSSECTDNRDSIKSRMDRHSSNESKVDSRVNCPSSDEQKTENTKAAHRPSTTKTLKKSSDTKSDAGTFKIMLPSMQKTQPLKRPLSSSHDVKKAFTADDDDSDEEVMPPSAKMRMRNIGKNTPTACGPNSFAKGKLGFCNYQKVKEIELERELLMSQK